MTLCKFESKTKRNPFNLHILVRELLEALSDCDEFAGKKFNFGQFSARVTTQLFVNK